MDCSRNYPNSAVDSDSFMWNGAQYISMWNEAKEDVLSTKIAF